MINDLRFEEYELLRTFSWYERVKKTFGDLVFFKFDDASETKASKLVIERQYEFINIVYSKVDVTNQLEKNIVKLQFYRDLTDFVLYQHDIKITQIEIKKDNINMLIKNIAKMIIPQDTSDNLAIPLNKTNINEETKNFIRNK